MKKLLIFLLAFLAIAAIAYFCVYKTHVPAIQADIQSRAQSALSSNGLASINAKVDGRDITLTGVASSNEMKQQAETLAKVNGYNLVNNEINVPGEGNDVADGNSSPRNHSLGISLSDNGKKITIDGILDANSHRVLKEESIKTYGEENVTDRILELDIPVADGMPEVAISMLGGLQVLNTGNAVIIGNNIQIKGENPVDAELSKSEDYFKSLVPEGYEISLDLVAAGAEKNAKPEQANLKMATKRPSKSNSRQNQKKKAKPAKVADLKRCQRKFNRILRKNKVRFNSSSSTVKRSSVKALNKLVSVAKKCSGMKITIHGHTDSTGRNKLNKMLSKKRARKVATYLANKGIPAKHLKAVGHGSNKPIASNKNEKGRSRNRRIEFTVESIK